METTASVAAGSVSEPTPPDPAWRRTYDEFSIASVTPAHGGGYVFVGRGEKRPDPKVPVRIVTVDETGTVRQRQEIRPDTPDDAMRAKADVIRTDNGYAVATGPWFAKLDTDLSVETTGFASEYTANSTTLLTELSDGIAVAIELDAPNHVSTRVLGFDSDGDLQWAQKYGERNSAWLGFLLDGSDGGLVVGGRAGDPWLVSLAADGTEQWQATVTDAPPGVGSAATRDDDGFTLFGSSSMVRLTTSRSVDWQRSYDPFRDASDGVLTRTAHGDYVIAGAVALNRIQVGRTDANGRLRWSHEYTVVDDGAAYLNGIVERTSGEYLVVGTRRDARKGWALLLSETVTPSSTPTSTSTLTEITPTGSRASTSTSSTTTTVPGFGVGVALIGIAAGLLGHRR